VLRKEENNEYSDSTNGIVDVNSVRSDEGIKVENSLEEFDSFVQTAVLLVVYARIAYCDVDTCLVRVKHTIVYSA
jgi:hypothetical protein